MYDTHGNFDPEGEILDDNDDDCENENDRGTEVYNSTRD